MKRRKNEDIWTGSPPPSAQLTHVYSIRLPGAAVARLRQVARYKGMTPSALLRSWVLVRIDAEYDAMLGHCPHCGQELTDADRFDPGEPYER